MAASDELMDLVFAALDHGIDSVRGGAPLTPFVIKEDAAGRSLARFVAATLEEGQARRDGTWPRQPTPPAPRSRTTAS